MMKEKKHTLESLVQRFEEELRVSLGQLSKTPSGFEKRDCMLCHLRGHSFDTRQRFGIRFDNASISIHCFNCGYKAHWRHGDQFSKNFHQFLYEIGMSKNEIAKWQFAFFAATKSFGLSGAETNPLYDIDEGQDVFPFSVINKWKELDNHDLVMLSDLKDEKKTPQMRRVLDYAKERGLMKYADQLAFSADQPYRLMIPFFYKNEIVGYTGRHIKGHRPKYLDKYSGSDTSQTYLYNYHSNMVSKNEYVIVTDGILDALHTKGIATLRTDINKQQAELISYLGKDKKVILVPDFDDAGFDFCAHAEDNGWYVSTPHWNEAIKDVDEMVEKYGRLLTIYSIIKNANKNYISLRTTANFMRTKRRRKQ